MEMRWTEFVDIAITAMLLWIGLHSIRGARTRAATLGLLFLGSLFVIAKKADFQLTLWLLQGLAALVVLIVVVIFQVEIRRIIESLPNIWLRVRKNTDVISSDQIATICETIKILAKSKTGGLIVFEGNDPLEGWVTEGTILNGKLSKQLLLSIFDASSPGHDGAIIIRNHQISQFGAHLPLSNDLEQLKDRGTRHAAALGLSEKCDALVIVVSEETGKVSTARKGQLKRFGKPIEAEQSLRSFTLEFSKPTKGINRYRQIIQQHGAVGLLAWAISFILWYVVVVPGSVIETATFRLPVEIQNLPTDFTIIETSPMEVELTATATRRSLQTFDPKKNLVRIDGTLIRFGRENFSLTPSHFVLPQGIELLTFSPAQIRIVAKRKEISQIQ